MTIGLSYFKVISDGCYIELTVNTSISDGCYIELTVNTSVSDGCYIELTVNTSYYTWSWILLELFYFQVVFFWKNMLTVIYTKT